MILTKSGNVTGDQRTSNWLPRAIQEALNGKLLGDVAGKLINPITFKAQTITYAGEGGEQSYDRVILQCTEGDIIVSDSLSGDLKNWANRLGDLTFKLGVSNRDGVTEYFRLSKPGGSVSVEEKALNIGQKAGAKDMA